MKATYNGITMEGTPQEIAELKRLLDQPFTTTKPPYQFQPWKPQTWPGGTTIRTGTTPNSGFVTYSDFPYITTTNT